MQIYHSQAHKYINIYILNKIFLFVITLLIDMQDFLGGKCIICAPELSVST